MTSSRTARSLFAGVVALALVSSACGTRLSHEQLLADARAEQGSEGAVAAGASASGDLASSAGPSSGGAFAGQSSGATSSGAGASAAGRTATTVATGSTGARAASCQADRPPLIIGAVGQLSGAVGNGVLDEVKAAQAWVAATNAKGGANCHRIQYLLADDGADPARHQQLVREMIEKKKVVAFLSPTAALTGRASVAYLTERRIPVVGGVTGPWYYESPMYFSHSAGGPGDGPEGVMAVGEFAKLHGKTKVGLVTCAEASDCASVNETYAKYAKQAGIEIVYSGQASALQPDYTSACQAAQRAGAEVFIPVLGPAGLTRAAQSCARVNYKPLYVVPQVTAQPPMASDKNLTPLGVTMPVLPWMVTSHPGIVEFQQALRTYAPGVQPGAASILGWVSAKLFEKATRNLKAPTSEAILEGLWAIQNDDLGGLTVPLTFSRNQPRGTQACWWLGQGENGAWTSPNGGQRHCV